MKHIVCLTKTYRKDDFELWFKYHDKMNYIIHIIDNESSVKIEDVIDNYNKTRKFKHTYEQIIGWPNQWKLYDDILKENRYNFSENDLIAFIDDDEYLWYYLDYYKRVESRDINFKNKYYEPLEEYLYKQMEHFNCDCILMPQILMSSYELHETRPGNLINSCIWTRNDISSQGKVFIKYNKYNTYNFSKENKETGHVPFINGERKSIVNGAGITESTYGGVDRTACLRLYHYHIKSVEDWNKKWSRGSAAVNHQWYEKDITKNKNFGGYSVCNTAMAEMKEVYNI